MARRQQPVCRDFQKGNCRFGAQCKFSHDIGQSGGGRPQKNVFGSNAFAPLASGAKAPGTPAKASDKPEHRCNNPRVCQDQIREDFQTEKPKWWTLSAYAHWKSLPNDISGDVSFEELRWEGYKAAQQGTPLQQVVAREQQLVRTKESEYQQLLLNPYRGPGQTQAVTSPPPAGTALLFGKPVTPVNQPTNPPFGQTGYGQPASFGTPPPAFGTQANSPFAQPQTQTQTIFGSKAATPSQSGFGQTPGGNIFGVKPAVTPSPFGAPSSPFGSQALTTPQTTAQTPFGGGTIFGRQATPGIATPSGFGGFGPQTPAPSQSIFGRTPSGAAPSPFGAQPGGQFGTQPIPSFGSGGASSPFGAGAQNSFGAANGNMMNVHEMGASPAVSTAAPPPSEPGGDPHRDVWLAEKFELGKIPEEEPPIYAR
ncbi:nucleoporin-like protein 2 [Klebsormidium nitens]|uniref:Nucleoporin-like protein 2 n=1 Tax=Klebsormidium nitens TaxID=105231 RepID=A0A1Y1I7B9_KLENI|nr:nucleoporin-like protein 2 [Klebsormidium nitens]|eukprot:GAQ84616.1 nucleoporin-like protein 2 [Klebsormidium nitens]